MTSVISRPNRDQFWGRALGKPECVRCKKAELTGSEGRLGKYLVEAQSQGELRERADIDLEDHHSWMK